jgi:hypothetical protein
VNFYCTLFDSHYLTRGLSLYRSLLKTGEDFNLIVYCFDEPVYQLLKRLQLERILLVSLQEFETPDLLSIKSSRSKGEYCWTCTPFIIRDALTRFQLKEVTYLDADLYFYQKPSILLDEFHASGASVLITEHRFTSTSARLRLNGIYCVQFMTFRASDEGMKVLSWWADRCFEWCYARYEDGKFGDQKYLDDWTTRFKGIHVLQHLGGGVAPWNIEQYRVSQGPAVNSVPVVFYHFHNLRWYKNGKIALCTSPFVLSHDVYEYIYRPYIEELKSVAKFVSENDGAMDVGKSTEEKGVRPFLTFLKRKIQGQHYVVQE